MHDSSCPGARIAKGVGANLPAIMFNPSQEEVRRFFCDVYAKSRQGMPLEALETSAAGWIDAHPEDPAELQDAAAAVARVYDGRDGRENPFLHLSMHLSISCLLYTSPSPRDLSTSRMPSSA